MRNQFIKTTSELIENDDRVIALLGEVTIFGFRHMFEKYPDRILNIGILEQASVSMAAGLSMAGMIPIFHTFAPFIVERAYEQLKLDFGYQKLGGNFVSMAASFDYASLGSTHHCPADVGALYQIPGMQIVIPGTAQEFETLYKNGYANGEPTYYRLTEQTNDMSMDIRLGKANVIKQGNKVTVIAVGSMLKPVLNALANEDVTILYYSTVRPFDKEALCKHLSSGKVLLCEPYYYGALDTVILESINNRNIRIEHVGVPHQFITGYGTYDEERICLGMSENDIYDKYIMLCRDS